MKNIRTLYNNNYWQEYRDIETFIEGCVKENNFLTSLTQIRNACAF